MNEKLTTAEFLSQLRDMGVELWVNDDKLRFNAPNDMIISSLREELTQRKVEIMRFLAESASSIVSDTIPLQAVSRDQDLPLSFAQERLWFLHHLEPDSVAYSLPRRIRLKGVLRKDTLENAYIELARRHETLRTTFHSTDGNPVQRIAAEPNIVFDTVDLRHLPEMEREAEARRLSAEDARKPFDLSRGPLFRIRLFQIEDEEHVLHSNRHHIISDLWSSWVVAREIEALYTAFIQDKPADLPELPVQYADYAVWQRQWLQGEAFEAQLNYWKEKLGGELPVLELPTDRPRPAVQSHRGAIESFTLPKELTDALQAMSRREGVTLFMTLLAAFKTLLYRLTGQEDTIVGTAIAGRNRTELEGLIGFFINTIVMRTDLSGQPTFRESLGRVRETAMGAYAHQDMPFERLVEELSPERDLSRPPLFQVLFNHMVTRGDKVAQLPGIETETVGGLNPESVFDMTLHVLEGEGDLAGRFEYNTDLFDAERIERMVGRFKTLLESIVADADQRISDVQILTDAEHQQLLVDWNDTSSKYPRNRCVHQLFEAQVEQSPDAVAVVYGDQQLTYRQLNARANQLAHYLKSFGVGPEVLVGICLERSLEMIIAVLGVLKTGGAYVPFDPEYPQERLAFMLADTGSPVLLTHSRLVEELPRHDAKVICMDSDWDAIAQHSEETPVSATSVENLAYVIYTSGSTGKPKGVAISHGGLLNLVYWHRSVFEVTASDRATQLAGTAFDASVWEVWPYLTAGARLHVVSAEKLVSPEQLRDWLVSEQITLTFLPTPLAEQVLKLDWPQQSPLRTLLTGGDKLHRSPPESIPFKVVNNYGPTENTVVTTSGVVLPNSDADIQPPIGSPISNTEIYVLDERLRPVPVGVPGELCIGGESLARGYLNRPNLTAENFIPNPYSDTPGARLYKSGDLVRYLQDGSIEFLGRIDHQVKIRGFRIELGEVESVLRRNPAVEEAVVIAREDVPGDKRLVAYVVSSHEPTPTFSELRSFLKEKLPDYMIPSAFGYLDCLPLTPNGKVDRRVLPTPDVVRPDLQEAFVAPRSQSEELVAGIWSTVLGLERIGVYDSFFELGGHSLLVVQIISRIREVFEVELPLRALFEAPTVAGLTECIEAARRNDERLQSSPLQAVSRDQDLPLSFAQNRLWFLNQLGTSSAYNIRLAIRLKGLPNIKALEGSLNEIIRRHEALRTTFRSTGGRPVQVIAENISFEMPMIYLSGLTIADREAEAGRIIAKKASCPFNLTEGPLIRATLLCMSKEEHILLLTMHHIVSDGWSMAILTRELMVLYEAFSNEDPSPLPELPIQYADFAHWQREWLQGEVLENQLSYWRKQLEGVPVLQLFTDRPRPAVQTFEGAIQNIALSPTLTEALKDLSQRQEVTLFMTLLAAFQTLLFRYTGQEDIVVGSPIANRNRTEIEGLIGFFVNILAMRTDLSGNPSFRELLGRIREVALGAYAHQDLPFEKLVEELHPERDMSRTPLFQIMFALQNMPAEELQLSGLTLSSFPMETITARFDMEIYLWEKPAGLSCSVVYNTDLFDDATIARLIGHYETLLESIVADPDQRISNVQILTYTERKQILVDWNDTSSEYPRDRCVHQLFEQQVEHSPDAVAVVYEDEQLTYRQLNTRANQLAHYLEKLGVGPEVLVGICLERCLEMVIAVLGILKAGGAYVPLDPAYPPERLAFMLSDAQIPVLLTKKRLVDTLPVYDGDVICLDNDVSAIAQESEENPNSGATPANLVYVIYTSGSTGRPKGVLIPHKALVNHNLAVARQYGLGSKDRVLQLASISFDLAAEEIFPSLQNGATVVLRPDQVKVSLTELLQFMEREKLTVLNPPTAYWYEWVSELSRSKAQLPPTVRLVIPGGEKASKGKFAAWQKLVGNHVRWINGYGPTEATITATNYEPTSLREIQGSLSVPIGRPIANTRVYILNPHMQPVPVGAPGELYIGGDGLARGYLNLPELSAEKFISDPFSEDPAARLFKSGDLARYLPDGTIEFLGRIDNQVKIRGFRIELGEVEGVLGQHPAVREAVVIAREDVPGDKRLVAYVVASHEPTPTFSELRSFLKKKLPDYMIPTAFVYLESLPTTPNGKVDRRALPVPDATRPDIEESFAAPRNPVEEVLAEIWGEILRIEKVGIQDNFFELGGHSLMATQLISRLSDVFQLEIPLRQLFLYPTIAEFALIIAGKLEKTEQETVKQLLDEFEDLSDEEAERLLAQELRQNERADRSE